MRFLPLLIASLILGGSAATAAAPRTEVCAACVKAQMEHLASDALKGRKCGSEDENTAGRWIADQLTAEGAAPGFGPRGYLQAVELDTPTLAEPAELTLNGPGDRWTVGQDAVVQGGLKPVDGPLLKISDVKAAPADLKGKVVFYDAASFDSAGRRALVKAGAAMVIMPAAGFVAEHWDQLAADPGLPTKVMGVDSSEPSMAGGRVPALFLRPETLGALRTAPDGARMRLNVSFGPPKVRTTYNVVGVIHGSAPDADRHAVLFSAHYDHLGVKHGVIFHGADDDASGTTAVLEFARLLGQGARPRRTVYFALFGCEEEGGLGARYFRAHTPSPLADLSANLEFEMIGLRDPKHPDTLMMTGWERSNLGPTLAAHGAKVGPDPYPELNFFQRSDNYELALKGVVAQTVGGWPVPPTYHDASDDMAHVDLAFMDDVIQSMVAPVEWLVNSAFQPEWNLGQKP